jgi:hypothetical protein
MPWIIPFVGMIALAIVAAYLRGRIVWLEAKLSSQDINDSAEKIALYVANRDSSYSWRFGRIYIWAGEKPKEEE